MLRYLFLNNLTLQEQSSCIYYTWWLLQLHHVLGHVGVHTITNVDDNTILHKLSIPIVFYISQVWVGCYWNSQFM